MIHGEMRLSVDDSGKVHYDSQVPGVGASEGAGTAPPGVVFS